MFENEYDRKNTDLFLEAFRLATDFSYNGIIILKDDFTVAYLNQFASEYLNIPIETILGKTYTRFFPNSALVETMKTGEKQLNMTSIRNNKKTIVSRFPIKSANGLIGGIAIFQDYGKLQKFEVQMRHKFSERGLTAHYTFENILCKSPVTRQVIKQARLYAESDSTILITGESGTGKEVFAQSIHNASARKDGPFVAINCAAIPENILESELFGYSEGAFTGASKNGKEGLFQQAHKGTVFLDEIGEMPLSMQSKLLRVLQEKQVHPIGSDTVFPVDIRIISATNKDLNTMVQQKTFRLDLLYRLNVLNLHLPPLRRRREDIILFADEFLSEKSPSVYNKNLQIIHEMMEHLSQYPFPGNYRELENILERASLFLSHTTGYKDVDTLLLQIMDVFSEEEQDSVAPSSAVQLPGAQKIIDALEKANGNRKKASEILGISQTTLWRKMDKYGIKYNKL
ncbi:MAG: sigma 54-interacting transcriptional regulator [Candidatus Metalachnospira sp.]|nr:sigma 54-interacting transcriptional regulator [Candidatus Metalachnospira sp.]